MERHEMQRQLIIQGATRSKQYKKDTSFLQNHTRAVLHVSQDQTKETRWKTYTHKSRKHWYQTTTLYSDSRTRHNQVEGY